MMITTGQYRDLNHHLEGCGEVFPRQQGAPLRSVQQVCQEQRACTPLEVLQPDLFQISS